MKGWRAESHFLAGFLLRLAFIIYGEVHDRLSDLPYTDVDYHVITDAAVHCHHGASPFNRHTYRYTPLLAWLALPNVIIHNAVAKIIFAFLDCIASKIIYDISLLEGRSRDIAVNSSLLWLYNPIVIAISTRGSSESVVLAIVLLLVYFHLRRKVLMTGCILGLAIHFKIYPIIYSLPLYLSLETNSSQSILQRFYPTKARINLTLSTIVSFAALTASCYSSYGVEYIEEGLLHHISRVDTRHNFSVYFYLLYLSIDYNIPGLSLITFLPQCILLAAYGTVYGTRSDVILSMFAQTVVFVGFNKVVTSQYFLWYLVFLPLVWHRLQMSRFKCFLLPFLWILAQTAWLLPAYLLEFRGMNTFVAIWLESVAFFCCNVGILMAVLSSYVDYDSVSRVARNSNQ